MIKDDLEFKGSTTTPTEEVRSSPVTGDQKPGHSADIEEAVVGLVTTVSTTAVLPVETIWERWYDSGGKDGHCTLCGDTGWIDTRGHIGKCGHAFGKINYCICPNGIANREQQLDPKNAYLVYFSNGYGTRAAHGVELGLVEEAYQKVGLKYPGPHFLTIGVAEWMVSEMGMGYSKVVLAVTNALEGALDGYISVG